MLFIDFLRETVYIILTVIQVAMFARALLSWFPIDESGKLTNFLYMLTEPVVIPVRMICDRFEIFRSSPIDMSFFIAGFIIMFLIMIL